MSKRRLFYEKGIKSIIGNGTFRINAGWLRFKVSGDRS